MRSEKAESPPSSLVSPNGRLCAPRCPQWRDPHNGTMLGNCRLLAWHEVRAIGPYPDSPEADLCPVLAIREAIIEPTPYPCVRCGRCQTWARYLPERDVYRCTACGAVAPGTPIRHGLLADVRWESDAVMEMRLDGTKVAVHCGLCDGLVERPADRDVLRCVECGAQAPVVCTPGFDRDWKRPSGATKSPDVTPWAEMMAQWISESPIRAGRKVKWVGLEGGTGPAMMAKYSGYRKQEGDGFLFCYPIRGTSLDEWRRGVELVVRELERRGLLM